MKVHSCYDCKYFNGVGKRCKPPASQSTACNVSARCGRFNFINSDRCQACFKILKNFFYKIEVNGYTRKFCNDCEAVFTILLRTYISTKDFGVENKMYDFIRGRTEYFRNGNYKKTKIKLGDNNA